MMLLEWVHLVLASSCLTTTAMAESGNSARANGQGRNALLLDGVDMIINKGDSKGCYAPMAVGISC